MDNSISGETIRGGLDGVFGMTEHGLRPPANSNTKLRKALCHKILLSLPDIGVGVIATLLADDDGVLRRRDSTALRVRHRRWW